MNDQFHLYQDENARSTVFHPTVQPNPQNDGFVNPKGVMSARKALGNITNNNVGFNSNIKPANSRVGLGGDLSNQKDVSLSGSQQVRVLPKESSSHKENQIKNRIDELIRGGIEFSAGPTWEEQEALKDLAMEEASLLSNLKGHRDMMGGQIEEFCNEMIGMDQAKAKRLSIIRDTIFSTVDGVSEDSFSVGAPPSPIENRNECLPGSLSGMTNFCHDDLANELP